jgi:hypothetical protein
MNLFQSLHDQLTAQFGPPRRYEDFWSWALNGKAGLEARVLSQCEPNRCELWIADPGQGIGPTRFLVIDSPEKVSEAIERLRRYIQDHPEARRSARRTG